MPEPAKDTAIEITPKPRASSVPIPRIVAEINRVASRVRDRNKKEEEDIDDADVLENDAPAPSPKPADIQIIRENTHYRGKKRLNILLAFLLVLISVLLLAVCVFLARIDENIRSGGGTNVQSLASPPPPSPYSPPPPPPTVITPSSIASIEHRLLCGMMILLVMVFPILKRRRKMKVFPRPIWRFVLLLLQLSGGVYQVRSKSV